MSSMCVEGVSFDYVVQCQAMDNKFRSDTRCTRPPGSSRTYPMVRIFLNTICRL